MQKPAQKMEKTYKPKPFVKWAGGKGNLLTELDKLLPANFDELENVTYIEPFVGGGAMLFYMLNNYKNIKRVVINDINPDLIKCYQLIRDEPYTLIAHLKTIENNFYSHDVHNRKIVYYEYRRRYNSANLSDNERAAIFIFLNHTCFNGLYRVNSQGKFNVPFGRYKNPIICNEDTILADHNLLSSVELIIRKPGDYKLAARHISPVHPNFIYFDPPYRPLSNTSYFKEYSNSPFGDQQQRELKSLCDNLTRRGCQIMVSNSDSKNDDGTSFFEMLYEGYYFDRIYAPRFINAHPIKRKKIQEVVIRNY